MNKWTVRKASDNGGTPTHIIQFDYKHVVDNEQWVLFTADRHWDNPHSDWAMQKRHLDEAKERNAPVIDVGDLFCAMQGNKDRRGSKGSLRPEHKVNNYFDALVDTAANFFMPYKDQFAVIGTGNHETAIIKHNEIDLTRGLCSRLGVEQGGYGGYIVFKFTDPRNSDKRTRSNITRYFHGSGGGGPVTKGVIQTNRRSVMYPDADIIVTGHVHESWAVEEAKEKIDPNSGNITYKKVLHLQLPTYKQEHGHGGWHDQRGAPPKPMGAYWVKFSLDGVTRNVKYVAVKAD